MRTNAHYSLTDPAGVKALIRSAPWATMVSATEHGLVASHYPFLLDEDADDLVLLSHVGRPDETRHALGATELLVIFEGPNGYVSPSWYEIAQAVPTWNFAAVHAYGTPEILSPEDNLRVLERLVDHFEDPLPNPFRVRSTLENEAYAQRLLSGTVGFALPVTRFVAKNKMSQDKPPEVFNRIVDALRRPGPYANAALAERMVASRGLEDAASPPN